MGRGCPVLGRGTAHCPDNSRETETILRISDWLENCDINAVTKWLVEHFAMQADKDEGLQLIRRQWERMDAEMLEADKLRLAGQGIRYSDEMTDEEFERLRRRADELRRQADENTLHNDLVTKSCATLGHSDEFGDYDKRGEVLPKSSASPSVSFETLAAFSEI